MAYLQVGAVYTFFMPLCVCALSMRSTHPRRLAQDGSPAVKRPGLQKGEHEGACQRVTTGASTEEKPELVDSITQFLSMQDGHLCLSDCRHKYMPGQSKQGCLIAAHTVSCFGFPHFTPVRAAKTCIACCTHEDTHVTQARKSYSSARHAGYA